MPSDRIGYKSFDICPRNVACLEYGRIAIRNLYGGSMFPIGYGLFLISLPATEAEWLANGVPVDADSAVDWK